MAPHKVIRLLLIDDHRVVREGLRMLIESQPGFKVVSEADNGAAALKILEKNVVDIILLDLDLGSENGLDLLPKILAVAEKVKVLILTGTRSEEDHRQAMVLGAMGIVQKEKASDHLIKAIQKVFDGEVWYDRTKMGSVFADMLSSGKNKDLNSDEAKMATLTGRELEVIHLIALGLKNKPIGVKLFISETTVRHHLTSVFGKLGVGNRLELIIYAFKHGLAKVPSNK
jgi:two-component system nitrate/nitrite response regulator NarL